MKPVTFWVALLVLCATVEVLYADEWPEWRGAGRRGILTETGLVNRFPADGLAVAWRTAIHSGYSGPAAFLSPMRLGRIWRRRPWWSGC